MLVSGFTKRSIASILVTAALALSSTYANESSHIRTRPVHDKGLKQEMKNMPIDVPRALKSSKGSKSKKKTLETTFKKGFNDDYDDMRGWAKINFDGKKMKVEYSISDGPEDCEDCYIAILDEGDCDDADDAGTLYKSSYWNDENPWKKGGKAKFSTTSSGRGTGSINGVKSGFTYSETHCKIVVVKGPGAKKKYSKSYKRMLKSSKSKSGDGTDVLLCGVLHKKGKRYDC